MRFNRQYYQYRPRYLSATSLLTPAVILFALVSPSKGASAASSTQPQTTTNANSQNSSKLKPVKVSVLYESECSDTRRFFLKQLVPTYKALASSQLLDVELVPFGKAQTLPDNRIICQHGPRECDGNRLFACIQAKANLSEAIDTIGCIFEGDKSAKECIEKHSRLSFDEVDKCRQSDESFKMMQEMEKLTGTLSYVPTVKINDKQSEDIQQQAESNLKRYVCKLLFADASALSSDEASAKGKLPEACRELNLSGSRGDEGSGDSEF